MFRNCWCRSIIINKSILGFTNKTIIIKRFNYLKRKTTDQQIRNFCFVERIIFFIDLSIKSNNSICNLWTTKESNSNRQRFKTIWFNHISDGSIIKNDFNNIHLSFNSNSNKTACKYQKNKKKCDNKINIWIPRNKRIFPWNLTQINSNSFKFCIVTDAIRKDKNYFN